ncbi:linoleate diol synthase [Sodiomyces alkalinus F11]|uniref:Linoleate diol synthase n=1 Tax=Sodiomyces alkalinus (strain CBS 110278 / VKM F-3762 / F11) TaxID=1314773 RepID=A0A3N2PVB5_SODAK|nr:linoleate diol synthase [Sodiomyces alkalinus F11]ROT38441.1 linoleate diol synthase [Sodiomyces alkalinus F11]
MNGNHISSAASAGSAESPGPSKLQEKNAAPQFEYLPTVGETKAKRCGGSLPKEKDGTFARLQRLRQASKRPLPKRHGDGSYPVVVTRPGAGEHIKALQYRDVKTLLSIIKGKIKGEKIKDDKTMIMERTIQLVAKLPHNSKTRDELTNAFVQELWDSLDHPPLLYVGDDAKYRRADGSNNNPLFPSMGAAGTTYARSCPPKHVNQGVLPDAGLVFDSIFARTNYTKHPNNVSSVLWYWATIIIHDLFWTDHAHGDFSKNKTSSYLDLSPLYGSNQEMQDTIRTFKDGKLKPDSFADKRLLGMPPGVCVFLIMFNRFHNHVAENLAAINEGGRFTPPPPGLAGEQAEKAWKKYDNDLFQTARLITCGLYINITLIDYVRNIINLNRTDTTWTLDPRQEAGAHVGTKEGAEAGTGNVVSAEFNLCYRWHSCISDKDDKWIQQFYGELLGGGKGEMTPGEMMQAFMKFDASIASDPGERVFAGYKRQADGRFDDDDLVECLTSAIEDCAGSFGGRNVPKVMRPVEILAILQGRKWNVAGLNEFRKSFGLKPYENFEDINSDPEIADALRHLYITPDNVELYPGIVAEEAKTPMVPGVGIAPTYTISRVVLSDAVCLVRGDRHYTKDYTPRHLTNWGFQEVNYDRSVNHGCVYYKLFLRAFPNHFKSNSVYAHYPMVVPSETHKILTDLGRVDEFDFSRPAYMPPRVNVTTYSGAQHVLERQDVYKVVWHEGLGRLMGKGGLGFMLSGDTDLHAGQRKCMSAQLYKDGWAAAVKTFYAQITDQLLQEKSYTLGENKKQRHVDLVRDVGNLAHVHFASRMFNLPLKSAQHPKGVFTEHEMYQLLAVIFVCVFFDMDPAKSFPLRQAAQAAAKKLGQVIETNVKLTTTLHLRGLFTSSSDKKNDPLAAYGTNMVKGLSQSGGGMSAYEVAWSHVLPTAAAMVPNQAQVFAQAVDYYLSPQGRVHLADLHALANQQPASEQTDALLLGYAMEGIRMAGTFGSYRDAAADDVIVEADGRRVEVKKGDRVFVSFVGAARDPVRFPEPEKVDPRRPLEAYIHYGLGPHACLGREASQVALTEMFRALFKRRNVRRQPGALGELKKVPRPGGFFVYMREDWSGLWPFPCSMTVMWDED